MTEQKRKTGISRLIEIAGTKKWWLIGSMALAVCSAVAQFIPFVSVYQILTELAQHASTPGLIDKDFVWHWAYLALGGIVLFGLLLYASVILSHIAAFNILYELRMMLSRKLVKLPLGFFSKQTSGQLKKIMSEDVERVELFVAHHIPDLTTAIVFPLLLLGYMFYTDWHLALVILSVFAVAIVFQLSMMVAPSKREMYKKYQEVQGQMNSSIVEYVRGIQVVKIFNRSTNAFVRLNTDINGYRDLSIRVAHQYAPVYLGYYTVLSSVLLILIPTAAYLLMRSPSYPDYVSKALMFLTLGGGMFFPMMKLMWMSGFMMQNMTGVDLVDGILDKDEIAEPQKADRPRDASVIFRDVEFAYDKVPILKKVSFEAKPGTLTALVGPSGAGKSTVAMLTARFWDIQGGDIRIGDVPIKQIPTEHLMDNVSFVFQDNMLFFDTIEENIRMGNKKASFDDVAAAAKAAQCHEFIEKLENGYKTLVGEGGTYLSGGEQQRIALARAILKNAPIVLLDEATAYADPENEGKILESFSHLTQGKTVLVIAHRLSTITNADQILVIDQGEIAERGKHDELLATNGIYKRMWDSYTQSREWVIKGKKEGSV
ncbi:MAG: ABC transporter ATP-binding protein [Breznakibacter sp.]